MTFERGMERKDIFTTKSIDFIRRAVVSKLSQYHIKSDRVLWSDKVVGVSMGKAKGDVFGVLLEDGEQETEMTLFEGKPYYLPRFFLNTLSFLEAHVSCEGIFRKSGSVNRQRDLRVLLEAGKMFPVSSNPHDVAALLKQYLRELPEPLLTSRLSPIFTDILNADGVSEDEKEELIVLSCLLLPKIHMLCLQSLMLLLKKITLHSSESLMSSRSLALVFAPNLLSCNVCGVSAHNSKKADNTSLKVKNISSVVCILIERADEIGNVPVSILNLSKTLQEGPKGLPKGHYFPRRTESMSGLFRDTWSKLRGRNSGREDGGSGVNIPGSPEVFEPSANKKPALNRYDCDSETGLSTPLFHSYKLRKKKRRHSILHRKKKPQIVIRDQEDPLIPLSQQHSTCFSSTEHCDTVSQSEIGNISSTHKRNADGEFGNFNFTHKQSVYGEIGNISSTHKQSVDGNFNSTHKRSVDGHVTSRITLDSKNTHYAETKNKGHRIPNQSKKVLELTKSRPKQSDENDMRDDECFPKSESGLTIGQRVRKRRQHERDDICISHSSSVDSLPLASTNKGSSESLISISQSDFGISERCVHVTSNTLPSHRPKTRARGKIQSRNKRNAVIYELGYDNEDNKSSEKESSHIRENRCKAIVDENGEIRGLERSEVHVDKREKILSGSVSKRKGSRNISPMKERVSPKEVYENDDNLLNVEFSPFFKSPGLLRKVASEITERFQHTPKQFAPIANNDSYLFAVEEETDKNDNEVEDTKENVNVPPVHAGIEKISYTPDVFDSSGVQDSKELLLTDVMKLRSYTPKESPIVTKRTRPSPFLFTPSWKLRKFKKRAKQYMIPHTPLSSTGHDAHSSVKPKSSRINKRGIQVSEWIL